MPWQFWVGLALGLLPGGLVGFLVGRLTRGEAANAEAQERIEEVDAAADEARARLDADLKKVLDETPTLVGKDLEDAINDDFDSRPPRLPPGHPMRRPGGK